MSPHGGNKRIGRIDIKVKAEQFCSIENNFFSNDGELLEAANLIFDLRQEFSNSEDEESYNNLVSLEKAAVKKFHKAINSSQSNLAIIATFKKYRLNRREKEIFLFLAICALGMHSSYMNRSVLAEVRHIQEAMNAKGKERLEILKLLSQDSKLIQTGLLETETEAITLEKSVMISEEYIESILDSASSQENQYRVKTYQQLLDRLYGIVGYLSIRSERDYFERPWRYYHSRGDEKKAALRQIHKHMKILKKTLELHSGWPLAKLFEEKSLCENSRLVLLALIGKELGFVSPDSHFFTGEGLIFAVSETVPKVRHNLQLLKRDGVLRSKEYIQVCDGLDSNVAVEDDATLRSCEFELTGELLEQLQIKRKRKSSQTARQPLMKMEQLVLCPEVGEALQLAINHVKYAKVLHEDWGLAAAIPYGRAVTLLFWGPPGVGKTTAAEGLAEKLEKRIIVANYAEIQNCWVGQTEKNIVRIFNEAREADAVLFWDEADAMFYDRDSANRNWEVRDINVLLQELEKYTGLCILSTNREISLDKALERRIAIKVHFEKPDREMALQIWKKIIPKKLPLAKDISFKGLAKEDLTGGEIKNVLLNAARFAICRGIKTKIDMADLKKAIALEKSGKWSEKHKTIGFYAE